MSVMPSGRIVTVSDAARGQGWRDGAIAAAVTVAIFLVHGLSGFPTLYDSAGDNDSLLRLVEVHDLLGGQGWFDLHQYRMGPAGGFVMHWSRFVDAPLALIILTGTALTGSVAAGDAAALVLWPMLLMAAALFLIIRMTRSLAGEGALFPAVVVGAVSLRFMGIFNPGAIDHHNTQLVLALAAIVFLLEAAQSNGKALVAGTCTALMLAVGMETAPYVAVAGAVVAFWFLVEGEKAARIAVGFGTALGLASAAAFFATVPAGARLVAQCDAFSVTQFALAACGGLGLAAVAVLRPCTRSFARRLAALIVLGVAVAAILLVFFPQCLADPYAMVDPRLRHYWLDAVSEAQPIWKVVAGNPAMAANYYATPLLALGLMTLCIARGPLKRADLIVAAFLAAAVLVSIWQVRGAMFSVPFAVPPLAAWVARCRASAKGSAALMATLKMLLAWLVSFSVTWTAAAGAIAGMVDPGGAAAAGAGTASEEKCQRPQDYAGLAALGAATVLASSNLGSPILRYTDHRVLTGPYHRNNTGNLLALRALMEPPTASEAILRGENVALVAFCPGDDDTASLAEWAPGGLMADLRRGAVPSWLQLIPETQDQPLVIYRLRPR